MIFEENLRQLYYFYIVAETQSFSDAANKLFISQPAISMQIKNLEKALGIQLITRGSSFGLTDKGEVLFQDLKKIFKALCEAEQKFLAYSLKDLKKITIGMSEAYSHHFIVNILLKFQENFPDIGLKFFTETSKNLITKLINNKIDIAITGEHDIPLDKTRFIEKIVRKEEIILVAPYGHRLMDKKRVLLNDILNEKIILKDENSATRIFIEKTFKNKKLPVFIECESSQVLKRLVREYNAVTFLTRIGVQHELKNQKFSELNFYKQLFMPIKIAYPKKFSEHSSFNFLLKTISSVL
jgi:DNA-binding transcriptional LysR family regulator